MFLTWRLVCISNLTSNVRYNPLKTVTSALRYLLPEYVKTLKPKHDLTK